MNDPQAIPVPPGAPLPATEHYGPVHMGDRQKKGEYFLRSMYGAQPRVLRKGDVLATGQRVCDAPRDPGDGTHILVNLDGAWTPVPAQLCLCFDTMPRPPDRSQWLSWHKEYWRERNPEQYMLPLE